MDQQESWNNQQQQKQWCGWRSGSKGLRRDNIDKNNLEPTYVNSLYLNQQNNYNRISLLLTGDNDNDNAKTKIINNLTPKTI